MTSPAHAHYLRMTAAKASADAGLALATGYELMLAKLAEDRRRLKQVQSIQRKIEIKRALLPEYQAWVEGALQGPGGQDDVLMTVMVWRIDTADWSGALQIAAHALRHRLALPDQYERSLGCLIAEEIAERALASEAVPLAILLDTDRLTADEDMPDEARAKLAKALGHALRGSDPEAALAQYRRALALHDRVGVRKDIERLERELKNAATTPAGGS
jgi:hypothetical protein